MHSQHHPKSDLIRAFWQSWFTRKSPVLRVAAKFAALMLVYYIVSLFPFSEHALDGLVISTARLACYLLNLAGEQSQIIGSTLSSGNFAITVLKACSCVEFLWFYCTVLIVFPSPWFRKIPGILIGVSVLLVLNLIRVMSLYYVGIHFPHFFDTAHEQLWGILLIAATVTLCAVWVEWARKEDFNVTA